jgi:hypothetical protein
LSVGTNVFEAIQKKNFFSNFCEIYGYKKGRKKIISLFVLVGSEIRDPRSGIRDPGSEIRDPGSGIRDPGSRIQDRHP